MTCEHRLEALGSNQIIIKAGTRLLIDRGSIRRIVAGIADMRAAGHRVLLVSSGAVGRGMEALGLAERPKRLSDIQALAAIGQCELMSIYSEECAMRGFKVAQLLLTAGDLRDRTRYVNVMNCINSLWDSGVLPIINENDSVSVNELKFSDNDHLASMLAAMTGSRLTIILTTENGLRDRNPDGTLGKRISVVEKVDGKLMALAGGTDDNKFSIGGMSSKLNAAKLVTSSGEYLWIADGRDDGVFGKILAGDDVGTIFLPGRRIDRHRLWLGFFTRVRGRVVIDAGAADALTRQGKSLLPSGVVSFSGEFQRGDTIEIADDGGNVLAKGLSNFSADECRTVIGKRSQDIRLLLGSDCDDELVHRDHLCLLRDEN